MIAGQLCSSSALGPLAHAHNQRHDPDVGKANAKPDPDSPDLLPDLTVLLRRYANGEEPAVIEAIAAQVYDRLHALAQCRLRGQPADASLRATALADEVFVKLFSGALRQWENRTHFFKVASVALRTVLIDHARRRASQPRTLAEPSVLDSLTDEYERRAHGLSALGESLERLRSRDPLKVEIVELRFFGGRTLAEVAELLNVSVRTVEREWAAAREWLREDIGHG
ncbi:MAG TPA: ECF-type sigma factor [Planctomycetota bacterium]|nr:ECF-type sigma factor [Planctomycetota bacterium]